VWLSPAVTERRPPFSGTPVAWKVTGLPARLPEVACSVFEPAVEPSVHEPTVATPSAPVVVLPPVSEPPPELTAKVTETPATGLPYWSVTIADGAVGTSVATVAVSPSPPFTAIDAAESATPWAWKVTEPTPLAVAVSVFAPAVLPTRHEPTVALPSAAVVAFAPVTAPPPLATAKVTPRLGIALPYWSVTMTDGAVATFVWTV